MKLCFYGNRLLDQSEHERVEDFSSIEPVRDAMERAMAAYGFRGMSAPQVGVSAQLIVVRIEDGRYIDMVNPEITRMYGVEYEYSESCASCPPSSNTCFVPRMQIIHVEASSVNSPTVKEWRFKGIDSRVIQHEIDHLSGTWFFDRVDERHRESVLGQFKAWKRQWASNGREFPFKGVSRYAKKVYS